MERFAIRTAERIRLIIAHKRKTPEKPSITKEKADLKDDQDENIPANPEAYLFQ